MSIIKHRGSTMPQLVLTKIGHAEWVEVPVPELLGSREALVRPIVVSTCDMDVAIKTGAFPMRLPYAVGHEFVAEVVEVAEAVRDVSPGDVVAVPFQISCGDCSRCRRGRTADCASVPVTSMYGMGDVGGPWGGALTELVRVPYADAMLVPLPAGVEPAQVASLDNLTDAWRTVAPHLRDDDPRVLVVGRLSIGLYAVAIAVALGAEVTYVDVSSARRDLAERLGAKTIANVDGMRLGRYPVTVSTDATARGLRLALDSTDRGGVCTDTGAFSGDVPLPLCEMYRKGVTMMTGHADSRTHMPDVLDLVATRRLDPSMVTTATASWDQAPAGWSRHVGKLVVIR